jgi:hypothetical protein
VNILLRWRATAGTITATDGVERDANGVPTAFRIWREGENRTDHGTHTFSKRSAESLMSEQSARGNLYSIDVDHLSLDAKAPPESRKAVGWHRLEVRAGELWAVDVEWTDAVRAGLTKSPPEWRYFSPAYDTEKKTGEIVSYLNTALTNNPATWSVTALASATSSQRTTVMNEEQFKAAIAAMMGDDDEKKAAARASLKAAAGEDGDYKEKASHALAMFGEPDGDEPKEPKEEKRAAEEPPKAEEKNPEQHEKRAASRTADAEALAKLGEQDRRIAALEKVEEAQERARVLATRPDLTKSQLEVLAKKPLKELPDFLALIPKPPEDPAAAARVTATRGETRNGDGGSEGFGAQRAARLPAKENRELRERMGTAEPLVKGVHWHPDHRSDLVFPSMKPDEARRILATRQKAGLDGEATRPADRANGGAR